MECNDMTFANLALKVNAKNGGTNHHVPVDRLGFLGKDTMTVGIDVTHPSPESVKGMPSVTAVVANIDNKFTLYPGSIRLQAPDQPNPDLQVFKAREMVQALDEMMQERLDAYRKNMKQYPKKILIYRDGVSESQYGAVLHEEYPRILAACQRCYPASALPPITIIVVTKRHHTRLIPTETKNSDLTYHRGWAKGNPKPGTVVDRGITMEHGRDFFLQAHAALQGTVSNTYPCVIRQADFELG